MSLLGSYISEVAMFSKRAARKHSKAELERIRLIQLIVKRGFDIVASGTGRLVRTQVFQIDPHRVRVDFRGLFSFSQKRRVRSGRRIKVDTLRSMWPVLGGKIPQLIHRLKGDISLMGRQCHPVRMLPCEVRHEIFDPGHDCRHRMTTGVSGLEQMCGPTASVAKAQERFAADNLLRREIQSLA